MSESAIRSFSYVSLKDWCRRVETVGQMLANPESYYVHRAADLEMFGPPDWFAVGDDVDVRRYGSGELVCDEVFALRIRNSSLWRDDTFMASDENVRVLRDNFAEGRYLVFLADAIAAGESYNSAAQADIMSHLNGEQLAFPYNGQTIRVNLYRDWTSDYEVQGPCVLMSHTWMNNYAHTLIELLPRFWWLEVVRELRQYPLLLPKPKNRHHAELLGPLVQGLTTFELTEPCARFQRLFIPTFLANGGYSREQIAWTDSTVRRLLHVTTPPRRARRIYVSRRDAATRRVLNEPDLLARLEPFGFETHVLREKSVREQVELFSEAEIVVMPHGAGCANIMFSPPGALLLELLPSDYRHPMYWIISKLRGVKYARLLYPPLNDRRDMRVYPDAAAQIVRAYLDG